MALGFTEQTKDSLRGEFGGLKSWSGVITFDNSYPTGGEAITAANFGMSSISSVIIVPTGGTRLFAWDKANSKILVYTALSTEAANASDQSSVSIQVLVLGR